MGMRGPAPRNPRNMSSRLSVPAGVPDKPDWLDGHASEEWERVTHELEHVGLLVKVDRACLAAYCQSYAELIETTNILNTQGRYLKQPMQTASGEVIGERTVVHPAVKGQKDALTRVLAFCIQFGLSPASRARVSTAPGSESAGPGMAPPVNKVLEIRDRATTQPQPQAEPEAESPAPRGRGRPRKAD